SNGMPGMPLDDTKAAWRKIFEEKLDGRPVWRVIVTHMHPDHIGNAGWLSRKFPDSQFWISRLEYVSCRMLVADTGREAPQAGTVFYQQAGWNEDQIATYKSRFGGYGRGVSRLPDAYHRLEDGDAFEMAGKSWRVITGNGHSPEHSCLYCPDLNVVISGDQLLPKISSNVSVFPTEPEANPLRDWLESCEKLKAELPEDVLVLPAHNEPFTGAHARLDHLIKGHGVALKRLTQRLEQQPRRVVDVFPAIFGRKIGDDVISMATGEAIAHLNYLIAEGAASRSVDADGVAWYRAAN
ncbi:MAG: MBL fold metallo-hydrolase, partial [Pseudomonadota bacterium]